MCHTNEEPAPWIALDFGKTVVIKRVEIFNRVKVQTGLCWETLSHSTTPGINTG